MFKIHLFYFSKEEIYLGNNLYFWITFKGQSVFGWVSNINDHSHHRCWGKGILSSRSFFNRCLIPKIFLFHALTLATFWDFPFSGPFELLIYNYWSYNIHYQLNNWTYEYHSYPKLIRMDFNFLTLRYNNWCLIRNYF